MTSSTDAKFNAVQSSLISAKNEFESFKVLSDHEIAKRDSTIRTLSTQLSETQTELTLLSAKVEKEDNDRSSGLKALGVLILVLVFST